MEDTRFLRFQVLRVGSLTLAHETYFVWDFLTKNWTVSLTERPQMNFGGKKKRRTRH